MNKIIGYIPQTNVTRLTSFETQFQPMYVNSQIKKLMKPINRIPAEVPTRENIHNDALVNYPLNTQTHPRIEEALGLSNNELDFVDTFLSTNVTPMPQSLPLDSFRSVIIIGEHLTPHLQYFETLICRLSKYEKMLVQSLESAVGRNYFQRSSVHEINFFRQIQWYNLYIQNLELEIRKEFAIIKDIFSEIETLIPNFINILTSTSKFKSYLPQIPTNFITPFSELIQSIYSVINTSGFCAEKIRNYRLAHIDYLAQPQATNCYVNYYDPEVGLAMLLQSNIYAPNANQYMLHILHNPSYTSEIIKWSADYYLAPFKQLRQTALQNQLELYNYICDTQGCNVNFFSNLQSPTEFIVNLQQTYYQAQINLYTPVHAKGYSNFLDDIYLENLTRIYDLVGTVTQTYTPYLFGGVFFCVSANIIYNVHYEKYAPLTSILTSLFGFPYMVLTLVHLYNLA